MFGIPIADLKRSLVLTWLLVSVPVAVSAAVPFVAPHEVVSRLAPRCVSMTRFGRPCAGCGLTTSFLAIGRSDWQNAAEAHAGGMPLFALFAANTIVFALYIGRRLRR